MSKILVVGMSRSSHLQKWLSLLPPKFTEVHFIESTNDPVDKSKLHTFVPIVYWETRYELLRQYPILQKIIKRLLEIFIPSLLEVVRNDITTLRLLRALMVNEYEVIHCFEIQHAGYALENILERDQIPLRTKIFVSCWGSDIYWFMNNKIHNRRISQLLKKTDLLILDTNRDIELSRSLGYAGEIFRINTHAGGIDPSEIVSSSYIDINNRKSIMIKGHFGFVGRPFFSIDVLMELAHLVNKMDLKLNIISCPPSIIPMIQDQLKNYNVKFKIYKPYELSRFDLIKLYRTSKMCIANSMSDGIPTTAIESMANGCVPIQSNTSSLIEWGVDPRIVLPPLEGNLWKNTIQHLLNNEEELKKIAKNNLEITKANFSVAIIQNQIEQVYELF